MKPYTLEFEIPCPEAKDLPRSLNNSIHEKKYFMWERSKWTRRVPKFIRRIPTEPLQKAKLTLTRCSRRRPDHDNMVMSWKFIIDTLVKSGVISDDSHKVIGVPDYLWESAKKGFYKIKIKVEQTEMPKEISI